MRQQSRWSTRIISYAAIVLLAVATVFIVNPSESGPSSSSIAKRSHSASGSVSDVRSDVRSDVQAVRPLWRCHESQTTRRSGVTKLGFVHVFKAAGSTISTLFEKYSRKCHAGYGRLVNCNQIDPESIQSGENWRNCTLKYAFRRNGDYTYTNYKGKVNNTYLGQHLDIIGGHQRLGSLDYLVDNAGNRTEDLRYVTFVRDAAAKFVSGVVFIMCKKEGVTPRDIIEHIYDRVETNVAKGRYHIKYANYLLTPTQAEEWKQKKHMAGNVSMETTNEMIMKNLVAFNVVVGTVERMSESMEMLHHMIDPDGDATDLFVEYGMSPPHIEGRGAEREKKSTKEQKHNASPLSASAVLRVLRRDETFAKKLAEYVKYEQQITDFATEIHLRQYNAMRMSKSQ